MLDRLSEAGSEHDAPDLGTLVGTVGARSFGPLLLVAGLIAVSPISGIPGVPTMIAVLVALIAVQLLLGRSGFWLPKWIMRRRVSADKLCTGLRWMRPAARFLDRITRPRLVWLTEGAGLYATAVLCMLIALMMPPLELIPFSATIAGAALASFGFALVTHDGLFGLLAWALSAAGGFVLVSGLF